MALTAQAPPPAISLRWGVITLGASALLLAWPIPIASVALVALAGAWAASRVHPARWFAVLAWGLAFHIAVIAVLFGGVGLPAHVARAIAAWKELLVCTLVLVVAFRAATGRGVHITVTWLDVAVAALGTLALAHLLAGGSVFQRELPMAARLYGLRDTVFFTLLYFIGRATPELADHPRLVKRLFLIGVVTSGIAILERLFVTPDLLVLLGAALYFQDFLNVAATTDPEFGLPANYWTAFGHTPILRAGSVYLSSQGFAIPFLVMLPAATLWLFTQRRSLLAWAGYAVVWSGLLLSVTRMTIIACAIQVVLLAVLLRRFRFALGFAWTAVAGLVVLSFAVPGVATYVWETLSWQTGSSASHSKDWAMGLAAIAEYPLGAGLGTTDQTAMRAGLEPLTADNAFLKYAVELGVLGLLLHGLMLVGIAVLGLRLFRAGTSERRRMLGALVVATTVGIALNAMTAMIYNSLVLSYLYFWLAGTAATVGARDADAPLAGASP